MAELKLSVYTKIDFETFSLKEKSRYINYQVMLHGNINRHLHVDAYKDDPRDLWEIPEVRKYFLRLSKMALLSLYLTPKSNYTLLAIMYGQKVPITKGDYSISFDQHAINSFVKDQFQVLDKILTNPFIKYKTFSEIYSEMIKSIKDDEPWLLVWEMGITYTRQKYEEISALILESIKKVKDTDSHVPKMSVDWYKQTILDPNNLILEVD